VKVESAKLRAAAALTVAATLLSGNLGSFGMPADAQRPDNVASVDIGRKVAETTCGPCHAIGRRGRSPNPKAPRFTLIAERYPNDNPAGMLVDGTVVRHPGMPEFRMLEYETDGLVAYIRRISRNYRPTKNKRDSPG
jgi:mono/diheme cytochrome c family protein